MRTSSAKSPRITLNFGRPLISTSPTAAGFDTLAWEMWESAKQEQTVFHSPLPPYVHPHRYAPVWVLGTRRTGNCHRNAALHTTLASSKTLTFGQPFPWPSHIMEEVELLFGETRDPQSHASRSTRKTKTSFYKTDQYGIDPNLQTKLKGIVQKSHRINTQRSNLGPSLIFGRPLCDPLLAIMHLEKIASSKQVTKSP